MNDTNLLFAQDEKYFLLGLMGSGKTYWAQRLSARLQIDWIDLDQQIEKAAGMTISEIFATDGEVSFRAKERDALQQLASVSKLVVSCGGGTPCFHNNMDWMNHNGVTIWLQPDMEELLVRLKRGKYKRPLIADLTDEALQQFVIRTLNERQPFYAQAMYHIKGNDISIDTFTQLIIHA